MEATDKTQIFEPRYPTRTVGYVFILVVLFLVVATLVFMVNVIVNDHPRTDPAYGQTNWLVAIISVVVGVVLLGAAVVAIRKFLSNVPQRVILENDKIIIENKNAQNLQVTYRAFTDLQEARQVLAGGQYEASYKQIRLAWRDGETVREKILSERDTTNFDELMDALWERCPNQAQGPRTYDR